MVKTKAKDEQLGTLINKLDSKKKQDDISKDENNINWNGMVLFFSFDIVNSTIYKTRNMLNWAVHIKNIFKDIRKNVDDIIPDAKIWRILGDELVFTVTVETREYIAEYIGGIYDILRNSIKSIKRDDEEKILSLKATAWLTYITETIDTDEAAIDNLFLNYDVDLPHGRSILEFLGNDIDNGFRIKEYALKGQLIISFEIAYLLSIQDLNDCIYIIGFKKLKGIWNGYPYPIICYNATKWDKLDYTQNPIINGISYELFDSNDLISEYRRNLDNHGAYPKYFFENTKETLMKICKDNQLEQKMQLLIGKLPEGIIEKRNSSLNDIMSNHNTLQLHLVAVCCDIKNKRILIAKRNSVRKRLPGMWEFGCAKADKKHHYSDSIKNEYEKDFPNLKIQVLININREDSSPIPYALYEVDNGNEMYDKGIIVFARILNANLGEIKCANKHSEIKFIAEDEIESFFKDNPDCVKDFRETLMAAFEKMNQIK